MGAMAWMVAARPYFSPGARARIAARTKHLTLAALGILGLPRRFGFAPLIAQCRLRIMIRLAS
jgi:hypothetical protein